MAYGSGALRTSYEADMALVDTWPRRLALALFLGGLIALPRVSSPLVVELVSQTALATVGALALHLLTGMAGQVSLGHAGFLAVGAFSVGILAEAGRFSPLVTLPAAALAGGLLGVTVGIPSLRLKGLYLALGTLAMHYLVLYAGGEYQARWGFNTGISVPPLALGPVRLRTGVEWYYALVLMAALTVFACVN